MPPLIFYFPYPSAGGVSVLFVRLAAMLQDLTDITLVDIPNGFMARNCPAGVRLIPVGDALKVPKDGILITQTTPPWRIPCLNSLPPKMTIFFWNLHPDNLDGRLFGGRSGLKSAQLMKSLNPVLGFSRKKKMRCFLRKALQERSIVFMDSMNAEKTNSLLDVEFQPTYLPVCSGTPSTRKVFDNKTSASLNCVWLGRIEEFKTQVLLHLIKRLDEVESLKLRLDIFGYGRDISLIEDELSNLKKLECEIKGELNFDAMDGELIKYDVLFAMGTSALEGAKLAIPTFCVDYSYQPIKGLLRFRMLNEMTGFNLAEQIDHRHIEIESTLEGRLKAISQQPEKFGNDCFEYWQRHHSPRAVACAFVKKLAEAKLTVGQLRELKLTSPDFLTKLKSSIHMPNPLEGWSYF